ncbi:MAG: hypothetical protein HYW91_03055 [Candidatus Sungbacteria bacterium]|nr:hypothetical protein [Candidatus Sungbacteria bacterium]
MKKFILSTMLVIFTIAAGWYYTPIQIREKLTAFIGVAATRNTGEIKNFLADSVLPEDPKERRGVLIQELKKNIAEIKRQSDPKSANDKSPAAKAQTETTQELIGATEKALEELEKSNEDKPASQTVTERIVEIILPKSSSGGGQCRQVCD